jgi:hypothetical protein
MAKEFSVPLILLLIVGYPTETKQDFEFTKKIVIDSTHHLDKLELTYNTILKEYESRTKQNG